jgi:GT2 family glycosyltransferase
MNKKSYDISVVMAFFNRKPQLLYTLNGFEKNYKDKYNFEVIIVDDASNKKNKLNDIKKKYSFPIKLIEISQKEKGDRINPSIVFNKGIKKATGKIIMIQNPECYHIGDIFNHTINNLKEDECYSYSCFNTNNPDTSKELLESKKPFELIYDSEYQKKNFDYKFNQIKECWYNHPTIKPMGTYFCKIIYKTQLDKIGGFDERFAVGSGYDDLELLLRIKHLLKIDVKIIEPDEMFVVHLYHERGPFITCKKSIKNPIYQKWLHNKELYQKLKDEFEK